MNQELVTQLEETYHRRFGVPSHLVRVFSPGRINVLGEHVDYNDGIMMPAAIHLGVYFMAELRNDHQIKLYSEMFDEEVTVRSNEPIQKNRVSWANYLLGVVAQFQNKGISVPGFNLAFQGDLPVGAGLSSSASLENGVAVLLDHLTQSGLSRVESALMAQKAEHDFAGVMCGIMDQFASMLGKKDHLVVIDSSDLSHELVPIRMDGYRFVLIDSKVKHSLASSAYNIRREESAEALVAIRRVFPHVSGYKEATIDQLNSVFGDLPPNVYARGKFVIEEIARVRLAVEALRNKNIPDLGALMNATHVGLSQDYDVSCPELDFLVASSQKEPLVIGCRMMGGGFGGCTLNLIRDLDSTDTFERICHDYLQEFGHRPEIIEVEISEGTRII